MSAKNDELWRGEFGDAYNSRNRGAWLERNTVFFSRALKAARSPIASVLEFGCGTGNNLRALMRIAPGLEASGIEINEEAGEEAGTAVSGTIYRTAVSAWIPPEGRRWDLVLSKGFLIHIPPEDLVETYRKMVGAAARYLLVAEYYNPTPLDVPYRGSSGRLWKRDFAGELLTHFPQSLRLLDYGFVWRSDPLWPQDDITWFLLEKTDGK